ncbi:hypothetical protein KAR91_63695 [Candidatus Pacearchaeota archaeon]|nr:hypothetical protein [Candidatus Pacearchaeota archaeon]
MRDALGKPYYLLRDKLDNNNISLATSDINKPAESELVIAINYKFPQKVKKCKGKKYLVINEPPTVLDSNWERDNHEMFDKVFTFNDKWVDNKKYFLLRCPNNFGYHPSKLSFNDRKLLTMIVGFKRSNHERELFSERIKAIKWMAENQPDMFDLYGHGWPRSIRPNFGLLIEKRFGSLPARILDVFFKKNNVYKGSIRSKLGTLTNYRFSLCYENTIDETGYITDKILDSMSADCVPVYLGADNSDAVIGKGCYIDKREFVSYDQLFDYLAGIDEQEYKKYQSNIKEFLLSEAGQAFTPERFSDIISKHIIKDIS